MKNRLLFFLVVSGLFLTILPAFGELNLKSRGLGEDEPADYTFNQRFALGKSLQSVESVRGALQSFKSLTERSKKYLSKKELSAIKNTDWESQYLGFVNWVGEVEGTLRKQDYLIKKLDFELAKERYASHKITKKEFDTKLAIYQRAEKEFQTFWDSFHIAD